MVYKLKPYNWFSLVYSILSSWSFKSHGGKWWRLKGEEKENMRRHYIIIEQSVNNEDHNI